MRWLSLWHRFTAFLGQHSPFSSLRRRVRRCCLTAGCGLGVVLLVLVLLILLLVLAGDRAFGQAPAGDGVMLLIDNSNSMYDLGGVGSDPDLLRIEAARLFTAYLGVDADEADHRLGVIFFGGEAELVVPLTPLRDDIRRAEIADLIAEPERMRWTDPNRALELAYQALFDDPALGCLTCHPPPLYTDQQMHDVGTTTPDEKIGPAFDTPTLRGLYDSAPYFHDGSVVTLYEAITYPSPGSEHDVSELLTEAGLQDMIAFLMALPFEE